MTLTATVELSCSLTNSQAEEILDSAAIGINYWVTEADIVEASEGDSTVTRLEVIPYEGAETYSVNKSALENAICHAVNRPSLPGLSGISRADLISCLIAKAPEEIEPDTANELIQIACFNEVIYG